MKKITILTAAILSSSVMANSIQNENLSPVSAQLEHTNNPDFTDPSTERGIKLPKLKLDSKPKPASKPKPDSKPKPESKPEKEKTDLEHLKDYLKKTEKKIEFVYGTAETIHEKIKDNQKKEKEEKEKKEKEDTTDYNDVMTL